MGLFDILRQFTGGGEEVVEKTLVQNYVPSITDKVFSRANQRGLDTQSKDSLNNLNWMADTMGKIESDNNPLAVNLSLIHI